MERRLRQLESRMDVLPPAPAERPKSERHEADTSTPVLPAAVAVEAAPVSPASPADSPPQPLLQPLLPERTPSRLPPSTAPRTVPTRPGPRAPGKLERLLVENWTGILGVLVVVAGVTFIVVNVGLQLGASSAS